VSGELSGFKPAHKPKPRFSKKLYLGMTIISLLGLAVMFGIVNTIVRDIIYSHVMGIIQRNKIIYARGIDTWFESSNRFVEYLTITWLATGMERGADRGTDPIAAGLLEEFDFFMEVYVGFADGSFVGGSGRVPAPDWDPTTRPWYKAAAEARGEIVTVLPFVDDVTGDLVSAVARWVPDLGGQEAVVAVGIRLCDIMELLERHMVEGGRDLVLMGPGGEIIFHPNADYNPSRYGLKNIRDIPNGEKLMGFIESGDVATEFIDHRIGFAYFMVFPLEAAGWTLAAIVPALIVQIPVFQNLALIMVTLALLLISLFAFTMFYVSRLTSSMEESRVAEERLRLIFDNMPMVANIRDKNSRILSCNAEAPKLFGLHDKREYMERFLELSPDFQPDGRFSKDKAEEYIAAAFATGKQRFEWMHQKPDGEPMPCEVSLIRVYFRGGDYILAFVRDLREFHDSQKKERMVMQRMQAILDSSPLMCLIFDENCNVLETNKEAERLFGIPDKQIFIDNFFDFSPELQPDGVPSKEKALAMLKKALATGSARYEWIYRLPNGTPIPVEEILERVNVEGRDLVIAHTRDLRDLHRYMETSKRMQFIFDNMPLVLAFWDKNLNMVECNQEAVRRYGLANKDEFKERFFDFSPKLQPDGVPSRKKAEESMRRGFSHGRFDFEWMHQKLDGTPIPTEVTCFRSEYMGEEVLLTCSRDMRDVKEAQQREREMGNRIQLMFNATPLIIEYWDKDFNCIECNQTALDFYGALGTREHKKVLQNALPELQSGGKSLWDIWTQHLEKIFKEGYARFDFAEKRTDGELAFLEVLGVCMNYNNDQVVVTYSNDVTQLKQTMVRMREADERTQLMLDGTPVACYLINKDFEAMDCNVETLRLFDFADKSNGIAKFRDVFPEYRLKELKKHFDEALETGADRFEWVLQKPDNGEAIPCDIAFIRFSHKGEFVVAAYIFDLSVLKEMLRERQRVEIAEESSRAKSRFLARMSHEIRTPLTAVLGISEIQLQNPAHTPATEEAFAKIHNSADTLLGIVNDILDLSKIEAGKLSLVNEKYEVANLIGGIVQLHLIYVGNKKVEFSARVDERIPAILIGDELRIKQILNNLLSNAFKYTELGSVELSLQCLENDFEDRVTLEIGVHDTGMGMNRKQMDTLYDEYTRFHEQRTRSAGGTGLGMSIVYSLVQMMDGKINVESKTGKGTSVVVHIPQKTTGAQALGEEAARNLQQFKGSSVSTAKNFKFTPEPMPYGRVLVVDDVEANLYVARGLLLFYDLKIETCESGYEAIEKVRQGNVYDIIFMDQMMPKLDGVETTQTLRTMGYARPIVALTANALIGQAEEFLKKGFDGFISKPIQTMHLNTILVKFIRDKQPPEVIEAAHVADGIRPALFDNGSGGIDDYLDRPDVVKKLRTDFARSQRNAMPDLNRALETGDAKTAYRLVHTLKGLAGTIKETALAEASGKLEELLRLEEAGVELKPRMSVLETELAKVLENINAATEGEKTDAPGKALDKAKTRELLEKLAESLEMDGADNLELARELRGIPEAALVVRQIEDFDFETAAKNLPALKDVLEL